MKRSTIALAGGLFMGTVAVVALRWYAGVCRIRNFHLTNQDLGYSHLSSEELASQHLIDLNSATPEQLAQLGLSAESAEHLWENRPYRSKLDLVSRMVLSQVEYAAIKDRVSVSEAGEPVKTA